MRRNRNVNFRSEGFTLLEALLSTILAAMIAVLILAAYNSTVKNGSVLLKKSERNAQLRYAMDQIRADLVNFYRCSDWQFMLLQGQAGPSQQEHSDRITFYAMREGATAEGNSLSGPWEVEYALFSESSGSAWYIGRRCVLTDSGESEAPRGTITKLAGDILAFHLEYFDQEQWVDGWQKNDAFPTMIRITLTGRGEDPDAPPIPMSEVVSLAPLPVFSASNTTTLPTESSPHETQPSQ